MAALGALLGPLLQGGANALFQGLSQKQQTKGANSLLSQYMRAEAGRQKIIRDEYEKSQKPLTENILGFLDSDPLKLLSGLVDRNLSVGKKITPEVAAVLGQFAKQFGSESLDQAATSREFILGNVLDGARQIGVDPENISQQMIAMLAGEDKAAGKLRSALSSRASEERSYGRSLRDGSFYSTGAGQQATQNLFSALAPMISSRGLDAYQGSAFAGAPDIGENRGITAFLRNAEQNRQYGDRVLSGADALESQAAVQPFQMRDALTARLGGLLTTGLGFGQQTTGSALSFGQGSAQAGAQFGSQFMQDQSASILGAGEQLGYRVDQAQAALGMSDLYAGLLKFSLQNSPYTPAFQYGQQTLQGQQGVFGLS